MPIDEHYELPFGCMECSSILPHRELDDTCPRCGSTDIFSMQEILEKAIEWDIFMKEMGLDQMSEYD